MWVLLLVIGPGYGQRVFYDAARDKTAQDAQKAADGLASGALFDQMMRNVAAQERVAVTAQIEMESQASRAVWNSIKHWRWNNAAHPAIEEQEIPGVPLGVTGAGGSVCDAYLGKKTVGVCRSLRCLLEQLEERLDLDTEADRREVPARLKAIEDQRQLLTEKLKQIKDKSENPDIQKMVDDRLGQLQDTVKFAQEVAKSVGRPNVEDLTTAGKALQSIQNSFADISRLYGSVLQGIVASEWAVSVDPSALRPPREKTDLELLAADEEYFRRLGLIRARTYVLIGQIHRSIKSAKLLLVNAGVWDSYGTIEGSIIALGSPNDRVRLENILKALHISAKALSIGAGVVHTACLQESFERRLLAIQHTAVESHLYEQTLQAAAKRLAIYWKAGIKPADLAQMLFNLASAASLPVLAGK